MADLALWHQPIATAYPQLNPEQARCLRFWLWDVCKLETIRQVSTIIQSSDIQARQQFVSAFKACDGALSAEQNTLLNLLIDAAVKLGCTTILQFFAEAAAENADIVAESQADALVTAPGSEDHEVASDTADYVDSIQGQLAADMALFPGLTLDPEFQTEIRRRSVAEGRTVLEAAALPRLKRGRRGPEGGGFH